jgi:uncharacterized membrane protein YbhN (UPF0104 family)
VWKRLLESREARVPFLGVATTYLGGSFFGAFLPTSLGSDAARILLLVERFGIPGRTAAASVVALNVLGLLAVCITAVVSSVVWLWRWLDTVLVLMVLTAGVGYIVLFSAIAGSRLVPELESRTARAGWLGLRLAAVLRAVGSFRFTPKVVGRTLPISALSVLVGILSVYATARALGFSIPLQYFVAFVPLLVMSQLLPLSVAGFGLDQGVLVFWFGQVGVPPAEAFLISVVKSSLQLCFAICAGVIYTAVAGRSAWRERRRMESPELP